jgi:methionyl aminopeptidase
MIKLKTEREIEILREGGKRHAFILKEAAKLVAPGVTTLELEDLIYKLIVEGGDKPSFLGYTPYGAKRPYPAASNISVNDEIVHGIPNEEPKTLHEGDIVSIDVGIIHKGMFTDSAITVPVGKISKEAADLIAATKKALEIGIAAALGGGHVGDIGSAIETYVKKTPYKIADGLAGHGVGYAVHEDPYVPNTSFLGDGPLLKPGMVLAIEPMLNIGTSKIKLQKDGYTYKTADGTISAHFEHTVLITNGKAEVLTIL